MDQFTSGPATGFTDPSTVAILSVHPAYQTQRSIAASTSAVACPWRTPSAATTSSTNCVAAALQHLRDAVEHLAAVVGGGARPAGGSAARAALTASRTSLRDASAACASSVPSVSVTG